ncbi:MAG: ribonuclease J [Bauldia sp.]|uniref:ribonuclease J n=1 Tax=Bauldia sp. TaxID=2575872 RepID=UPI001D5FA64D|nr:ribonuclease J [Bauldia sp.]MCB1495670.1 ribonuclease J [Bauldia sp.]
MNLGLYGYGPAHHRTWIAVDFGIAFPGEEAPGADVIFPDISYLEEERINLAGILITHAHEDHYGALIDLWPRLRVPVFATAFTAGLLNAKRASEPGAETIPVTIVAPGGRFKAGPFEVEYINVTHSIPEANALAIRTPLGLVLHSGDWKLDDTPVIGLPTDEKRLREIGEEGVLALVCDSTNAYRDGRSPSEREVALEIEDVVAMARGRVAFTTFSSNVGRIRSIALAAAKAGREVVVVGRAIRRMLDVAGELGILAGLPPFLEEEAYQHLPRNKVVALLTGSQGESRAALARIAGNDHRHVAFDKGDLVVFSSRAIPGNEVPINRIINSLVARGVRVMTDRDRLVHVSGHPRREEMRHLYGWLRPEIAVPVHGEAMHLEAHAELAEELGVKSVLRIENGTMVRLAPDAPGVADEVEAGRLYRDGRLIGALDELGIAERRRLSFAGHVSVSVVIDAKGELLADPQVGLVGVPAIDAANRPLSESVLNAALGAIESIPRRRRHAEIVREAVRRAVRAEVAGIWGKKPNCTVFLTVV